MGSSTRLHLPYPDPSTANNVPLHMQQLATAIDSQMAVDLQGLASARPNAGTRGRYYWATDGTYSRDDGSAWRTLPQLTSAQSWTARQTVTHNSAPQVLLYNATTAADSQLELRHYTANDFSTYKTGIAETLSNVFRLRAFETWPNGSDFSGMNGKWAINHNANSQPDDLFVVKHWNGTEAFRITDTFNMRVAGGAYVGGTDYRGMRLRGSSGLEIVNSLGANSDPRVYISQSDGTNNYFFSFDLSKTVFKVGSAVSTSGAPTGAVALSNIGAVATNNPTAGGFLYVEGGTLSYMGSSGTITRLANP